MDNPQAKLNLAFRPHSPISDPVAFQGRVEQRNRVEAALDTPGLHVVIYGERGAGKTSLANVAVSRTKFIPLFCEEGTTYADICRAIFTYLQSDDPEHIVYDAKSGIASVKGVKYSLTSLSGNELRLILPENAISIVIDELDRIKDDSTFRHIAELCKHLSTYRPNVTLVLVGVSDTASQLLNGHASNSRNLRQVQIGRMSPAELHSILKYGENILSLRFSDEVTSKIIRTCDNLPYFLHLLAMNAAREAISRGDNKVEISDYFQGLLSAANDCDEELRSSYDRAIKSAKTETYRRIVWALAEHDDVSIAAAKLTERANDIAASESDHAVKVQAVAWAARKLLAEDRGAILREVPIGFYMFSNPLMRGYVRLLIEGKRS